MKANGQSYVFQWQLATKVRRADLNGRDMVKNEGESIWKVSAIFYQPAVTWRDRRGHNREYQPEETWMRRRRRGMKKIREIDSLCKAENEEMWKQRDGMMEMRKQGKWNDKWRWVGKQASLEKSGVVRMRTKAGEEGERREERGSRWEERVGYESGSQH